MDSDEPEDIRKDTSQTPEEKKGKKSSDDPEDIRKDTSEIPEEKKKKKKLSDQPEDIRKDTSEIPEEKKKRKKMTDEPENIRKDSSDIPEEKKKRKRMNKREMSMNRMENFKKEVITDCHIIPLDALCTRLETSPVNGLSKVTAKKRLTENGPNALTPSRRDPEVIKFLKNLTEGFSMLLWIGALLCFVAVTMDYLFKDHFDDENFILGCVLVAVIVVTGIFTYCQERKSSQIMDSFSNMIPQTAMVIREGEKFPINVRDLVVGDLVEIQFGDRVPADVRIIKSQGFKVDNSSLTGENEPLLRTNQCTNENYLETKNIAFFSTNAVEGTAVGVVVMAGDMTVMGRIAGLTARLQPMPTPIARELHRFMRIVTIWACFLGFTFGIACAIIGYSWIDSALFIIGIIVANVPEGLIATVTVSLTVTAKKMVSKNCLVKHLEAVETLGSTSVICSDKTGTLTQNRMTVCHLWFNGEVVNADVSADQYDAKKYSSEEGFKLLMRCATLCNRAEFASQSSGRKSVLQREVLGDASEAAIFKFVEISRFEGNPADYRKKHPKLIEIPFSSTTKYQVSVHGIGRDCLLVMKGAPERVLDHCKTIYYNNSTVNLDPKLLKLCDTSCMELAARGERVLGFCDLELRDTYSIAYPFSIDPVPNFPLEGLRFVGFISLIDPPRPQVHDAVERCRIAGIKVVMVTGDHPVTAKSIAKEVGIISVDDVDDAVVTITPSAASGTLSAIVVPGTLLKELSISQLDSLLDSYDEIVFARTSPTQKLHIVEGFQRLGMIVAVTGDGVNDAPALKKADIGIAMGISGSEVSKQSADMILLDDNFASIVIGIEEGRKIFDNLKKSIVYILASNVAELMPVIAFLILNIPLPIGILAILCIDIFTDMMPAISLSYEKAESNIMLRPPRSPNKDNLVTFRLYFLAYGHIGMIEAYAGFFVYFMIMQEHGFSPDRLLGLREQWDSKYINDLEDSFGHQWSYSERKELEYTCSTAFFVSVVICQWGDVIACKTRNNSIRTQKMTNWVLNISIIVETLVAILLSYVPFMSYLKFFPLKFRWWLYPMPYSALIIAFDEYRKRCIRMRPDGYFYRETYY